MPQAEKQGLLERGAGFFERLHKAIGVIAVAGAVMLDSPALAVIGVYEFAHGYFWKYLKERTSKQQKTARPAGRAALTAAS